MQLATDDDNTAVHDRQQARRGLLAAAGALALAASGCGVHVGSFELRFSTIAEYPDSGIVFASTVVVRNSTQWYHLWYDYAGPGLNPGPPPFVDFSREIIVAVFLGQRPDRCHRARVERVVLLDDRGLVVRWREVRAGTGQFCTPAVSYPGTIARIPLTEVPVRFEQVYGGWSG